MDILKITPDTTEVSIPHNEWYAIRCALAKFIDNEAYGIDHYLPHANKAYKDMLKYTKI